MQCPLTLPFLFFYFNLSTSVTIILLYNSMSSHDSLSFFPSRNKHILHQIRHDTNLKTHHKWLHNFPINKPYAPSYFVHQTFLHSLWQRDFASKQATIYFSKNASLSHSGAFSYEHACCIWGEGNPPMLFAAISKKVSSEVTAEESSVSRYAQRGHLHPLAPMNMCAAFFSF